MRSLTDSSRGPAQLLALDPAVIYRIYFAMPKIPEFATRYNCCVAKYFWTDAPASGFLSASGANPPMHRAGQIRPRPNRKIPCDPGDSFCASFSSLRDRHEGAWQGVAARLEKAAAPGKNPGPLQRRRRIATTPTRRMPPAPASSSARAPAGTRAARRSLMEKFFSRPILDHG